MDRLSGQRPVIWLKHLLRSTLQYASLNQSLHSTRIKAYIPLRRKTIRIGYWHWLGPPTPQFCVTYTNMLVSKNAKNVRHPTQNPNASQWNIGCVGFQTQHFRVGQVHFMFFVWISIAFGGQHKPCIQWNMGLTL